MITKLALTFNALPHVGSCNNAAGCSSAGHTLIGNILTTVFAITGAVALVIITLAGIQYMISQGDPQKTAKAKNTILYALIGLGIAILSTAIVNFVFNGLFK